MDDQGKNCPWNEALPGYGGSQVAGWNFKMSRVSVLSRVHVAVGN